MTFSLVPYLYAQASVRHTACGKTSLSIVGAGGNPGDSGDKWPSATVLAGRIM